MLVEHSHAAINLLATTSVSASAVSFFAGTQSATHWLEGAAASTLPIIQWGAAFVAIAAGLLSIVMAARRIKDRGDK